MSGVVSSAWNASKQGVLANKLLGCKTCLEVIFGKFGTYKSKYTLKPLLSQVWCIVLEEQSQRPTPKCTSSTELKDNSPLT